LNKLAKHLNLLKFLLDRKLFPEDRSSCCLSISSAMTVANTSAKSGTVFLFSSPRQDVLVLLLDRSKNNFRNVGNFPCHSSNGFVENIDWNPTQLPEIAFVDFQGENVFLQVPKASIE
jgi:hypothetical protein